MITLVTAETTPKAARNRIEDDTNTAENMLASLVAAEAKVEQLVGDLHAVSADYAEVRAQVETLVAALREIRDKEDAYAYKYMAREALREVGRE
jgi:uncharacterized membrane protein